MAEPRIYRHGDPEPPAEVEVAVLCENGAIAVRDTYAPGGRWRHGMTRSEWADMLVEDMVVVGIDMPTHPDRHAVTPAQSMDPQWLREQERMAGVRAIEEHRARWSEQTDPLPVIDVPLPLDLDSTLEVTRG